MELRRELLWTIGVLVALNLVLAFGCIGVLVRMGPAIERILQENVYSIVAGEEILAELARAGDAPLSDDAMQRVADAVDKAKRNVTEEAEHAAIAALERRLPEARRGDPAARADTVDAVRQLMQVNRQAMHAVDADARPLGSAGAWAAALIGFGSFVLSLFVVVRFQSRFVKPLVDLYEVLESAREGDRHRRCRMADAPREVTKVAQSVNRLLDERLQRKTAEAGP